MNMNVCFCKPLCSRVTLVGLSVLALVLLAGTMSPTPAQSNPAGTVITAQNGTPADSGSEEKQAAQAKPQPSAKPAAEGLKLGAYDVRSQLEVGYRWSSGIDGNHEMYRSQVNLFQGVRLLNSYVTMRGTPGSGLFDKLDLSLNNWGDPFNTLRFNVGRMDLYQLQASYRTVNYFNYISSLANPLLGSGSLFAPHNLNVNYRMSNVDLRLFPNRKIVPYFGYSRNSGAGPGYTTVGQTGNEFLLQTNWGYTANEYRGGLQFNLPTLNLTLEQGYRELNNSTVLTDAGQPQGYETRTFFGRSITLDSLDGGYHGTTKLPTSKVLAKFNPFENLRMTARYIYSMGDVDSSYGETRAGNLISLEDLVVYGSAADSLHGRAKKPNHNGAFQIEYSPFSRLLLTDSVDTLDYHISGAGLLSTIYLDATSLLGPGESTRLETEKVFNSEFLYNEVRNQAELEFEIGKGFAARAGHRYTFVDVTNNDSEAVHATEMSRQTALVGMIYRPTRKIRFGFDYENNQTNQPITRTDLIDYDQFKFDWQVGAWKGLSVNGRVAIQRNTDPASDIDFKSHDKNYIVGLNWEPNERFSMNFDYSHTNLFSELSIVIPQKLETARSLFDERISGVGGRMGIGIYRGAKAEFGYRGILNRGTAPLNYYQPYASLWIPLGKGMALRPSWQYFQYDDKLSTHNNYKTNLMTFSLVYSR